MKNVGYIALHRKIRDNFLWKERRSFSKAEAWLDILMETQHSEKPQQVALGMTVLTCNYGESLKSIRTWAKRWRWSQNKVRRFFKLLQSASMIVTKSEQVTTRLTVCNYGKYDIRRNDNGTAAERQRNRSGTRTEQHRQTDNNVKNEKNVKNDKKRERSFFQFQRPSADEVSKYAKSIGCLLDGEQFVDFYEAKDWFIGRNKMKDWKAAVRTWKVREQKRKGEQGKNHQRCKIYRRDTAYGTAAAAEGSIEI